LIGYGITPDRSQSIAYAAQDLDNQLLLRSEMVQQDRRLRAYRHG
jgi:hypothetical protein